MNIKDVRSGRSGAFRATAAQGKVLYDAKKKWDALAEGWQETGPPSSPSRQDIASYRRYLISAIGGIEKPEVILLGCTPKLRSMIGSLGVALTCVDVSAQMILATGNAVRSDVNRERVVRQNWLRMRLGKNRYAAILGDKVFDNLPHNNWNDFKKNIIWHLTPSGSLVTRVSPCDPSLIGRSFGQLFREWLIRYRNGEVSCRDAASGLWEQALGASSKVIPGPQTIGVFRKELDAITKGSKGRGPEQDRLLGEFARLFGRGSEFQWTAYTLGDVIDTMEDELILTRIARSSDYLAGGRQPVLQFKVRV